MQNELTKHVKKKWGYEEIITNNELYCGKILHLDGSKVIQGQKLTQISSIHYHNLKTETFYCLSGFVVLNFYENHHGKPVWYKSEFLNPTKSIKIQPMDVHAFYAPYGPSKIIEFSTQDFPEDSIKLTLSKTIILE